ncbi:MAG: hypothetical protein M3464_00630 [Chloroflexota bacterium]|nr:hypothetical protein [Chloroflexota bacterium]
MGRSLSLTPSISHALDRGLDGSGAARGPEPAPLPGQRFGADILGLTIFLVTLAAYALTKLT